jgi:ABC-type dipeptide/oligopeptide/nickel transport system permease component
MDESIFKKFKSTGACSLACGIIVMVVGVATGVLMVVNGARLLGHKFDQLF